MSIALLLAAALVALAVLAFHLRQRILARWRAGYARLGFDRDLEDGFSSANFDLNANIAQRDPRALDGAARARIGELMVSESMTFDDARLLYVQREMAANGVAEDGVPTDPKTVTWS